MENNTTCCNLINELDISWFYLDKSKVMPYICSNTDNKKIIRVNYCPSCGAYIKDIKIKQDVPQKIKASDFTIK